MDFSTSGHCQRWLFPPDELARRLAECHQGGRDTGEEDDEPDAKRAREEGSATPSAAPELPITLEEARKLLSFYEGKLGDICRACHLPKKVQVTALFYFKRFFVGVNVFNADPIRVLATCVFLASKVEDAFVKVRDLHDVTSVPEKAVLQAEVGLLAQLQFDLLVHSPYRALQGLLEDVQDRRAAAAQRQQQQQQAEVKAEPGSAQATALERQAACDAELLQIPADTLPAIKAKALSALDWLMLTDGPLVLAPSVLALAALRSACSSRAGVKLHAYLGQLVASGREAGAGGEAAGRAPDVDEAVRALLEQLGRADRLGQAQSTLKIEQQEVVDIDRRIKEWRKQAEAADAAKQASDARSKAERREAKKKAQKQKQKEDEARLLGVAAPGAASDPPVAPA